MKLVKSIVLSAVAFSATVAYSQDIHNLTPEQKAEKMTVHMTNELSLNEEQTTKLNAVHLEFVNHSRKIKSDKSISQDVKKAQIKAAKNKMSNSVKGILSAEQYTAYETWKTQMHSPEAHSEKETKRLTEALDLTPEQQEKVAALTLKVAQKIKAVKEDASLSSERKKEFIKGNMGDKHRAMSMILTPEQMEKYDALVAERQSKARNNVREMAPAESTPEVHER